MSHVLVLSLEYFWYKKDATIRVYADDRLAEEITLSDHIKLKTVDCDAAWRENDIIGPKNWCQVIIVPDKLFLIRIHEKYLRNHIRIEVINNFNNYSNGFMTKFAYVKFHDVFIVPECALRTNIWNLIEYYDKKTITHHSRFNQPYWPHRPISLDMTSKHSSLAENFSKISKIGGDFSIKIRLHRKHNLIHLGVTGPGRFMIHWFYIRLLWAFKAINMFDEDQRNID